MASSPLETFTSYQTALAVLLPPSLPSYQDISTLRSLYDKNYLKWPPHINLVYPFVPPEGLPSAIEKIQTLVADRRGGVHGINTPIKVRLADAGLWEHKDHATVYLSESLRPESDHGPGLGSLRQELLHLFRAPDERPYTPHLTIGQTALDEEVMQGLLRKAVKLVQNAPGELHPDGIEWDVTRLVVLERGIGGGGMRIVSEIILHNQPQESEASGGEAFPAENDISQKPSLLSSYEFSPARASYIPYVPSKKPLPTVQDLTLATYNIFTDSAIPTTLGTSRYPLLLSAVLSSSASIVCLQEVTDDFLAYLLSQPVIQSRFPYSTHSPSHSVLPSWRNCVTLSTFPLGAETGKWEFVDLGKRHKGAVIAEVCFAPTTSADAARGGKHDCENPPTPQLGKLVIANVHLTCGISDGSSAVKVTQLRLLTSHFLNRQTTKDCWEVWAVCGDLNVPTSRSTIINAYSSRLISEETYNLLLNKAEDGKGIIPILWQDTYHQTHSLNEVDDVEELKFDFGKESSIESPESWKHSTVCTGHGIALGAGEFGATFNPFTNRLAAESVKWGANPRPQRYDRILVSRNKVRGSGYWLEVQKTSRFGIESGSDHWGLSAKFHIRELGTAGSQGSEAEPKGWLTLDRTTHHSTDMTNEALQEYLRESKMIPSQNDYAFREEATEILRSVLNTDQLNRSKPETVNFANQMMPTHPVQTSDGEVMGQDDGQVGGPGMSGTVAVSVTEKLEQLSVVEKPRVKIVVQPVGSYYMNLFTPTSDLDILSASNISPRIFWVLARQRIRRYNRRLSKAGKTEGWIRVVRTVEAHTGTMMELEIVGRLADDASLLQGEVQEHERKFCKVRIDLQYCQVPDRVLDSWSKLPYLPVSDPIFSLPASTLRKLNAYRDSAYLLQTIPHIKLFRLLYRFLKLWATRRGIFSARFGYLGGVHLVLLLARLLKKISPDQLIDLTAAEALQLFFDEYSGFKYEEEIVRDPEFSTTLYRRTISREPLVICTIHSPIVNAAHTASRHTLRTFRGEALRASQTLKGDCGWNKLAGGGGGEAEREFLDTFGHFIKIDIRYWGRDVAGATTLVGWIESRCVLLLVELNAKIPSIHARMWPARFRDENEPQTDEEFHGFYLIGLLNTSSPLPGSKDQELDVQKKIAYNKFMDILRSFEEHLCEQGNKNEVPESYIAVTRVGRQDINQGIVVDKRVWWDENTGIGIGTADEGAESFNVYSKEGNGEDDGPDEIEEDSETDEDEAEFVADGGYNKHSMKLRQREPTGEVYAGKQLKDKHKKPGGQVEIPAVGTIIQKGKLRPAQDIINRIKWDPDMDIHDYIIGYEDRFVGVLEMSMSKWASHRRDETDEEWVPLHRVVWVKRASDSVMVWDREKRVDEVFGSGTRVESVPQEMS